MTDPKPKKPTARKTTRSRGGATPTEGDNAAAPESIESRASETPVLAIEQVSDADSAHPSSSNESDHSDAADEAYDSDGLDGEIRRRAYEIYLARGGAEGNELEDWLAAERSVRSRRSEAAQRAEDLPPTE